LSLFLFLFIKEADVRTSCKYSCGGFGLWLADAAPHDKRMEWLAIWGLFGHIYIYISGG
jgi:hypothetical protein